MPRSFNYPPCPTSTRRRSGCTRKIARCSLLRVICLVCTCTPGSLPFHTTCRLACSIITLPPFFPRYGNCFELWRMEKLADTRCRREAAVFSSEFSCDRTFLSLDSKLDSFFPLSKLVFAPFYYILECGGWMMMILSWRRSLRFLISRITFSYRYNECNICIIIIIGEGENSWNRRLLLCFKEAILRETRGTEKVDKEQPRDPPPKKKYKSTTTLSSKLFSHRDERAHTHTRVN